MGEAVPVPVTAVPPPWGVAVAVKPVLPVPAVKVTLAEVWVTVLVAKAVGALHTGTGSVTQMVKPLLAVVEGVMPVKLNTRTK